MKYQSPLRFAYLGISLAIGLLGTLSLSGQNTPTSQANSLTVCPSGRPNCTFTTLQAAVDAASDGDVIKVGAGTYTDLHVRPRNDIWTEGVVTQVVYLTKSVIIQGGYVAPNFSEPPDPLANPTILDAQQQGRVVYITGAISPTLEGLWIMNGNATGQAGNYYGDAGGGIYVLSATLTLSNSQILSNTAANYGDGGGVFLLNGNAVITANTFQHNTAPGWLRGGCCLGGGIVIHGGVALIATNTFSDNHALQGGSIAAWGTEQSISGNSFISNSASYGGGVYLNSSSGTVNLNTFTNNLASNGGAAYLVRGGEGQLSFIGNLVTGNQALINGGGVSVAGNVLVMNNNIISNAANYDGGGLDLYVAPGDTTTLMANLIQNNSANGRGGGVNQIGHSTLNNNLITNNVAGTGGGLSLLLGNSTLINNRIAENQALTAGSGLYLESSSIQALHTTLVHNTGGDGSAIAVTLLEGYESENTLAFTNTIVTSHTVGITTEAGITVTFDSTLWYANTDNWSGAGTIVHINDYAGDPNFANAQTGDYHLGPGSAALDQGLVVGVNSDFDNQPRPFQLPDLGADEYWPPGALYFLYLPLLFQHD